MMVAVTLDSEALCHLLKQTGLVSADQVDFGRLAKKNGPQIVEQLKQLGHLTSWQANELLSGRDEFVVDKYLLLEPMEKGRLCDVYKARRVDSDLIVALRLLETGVVDSPSDVARFEREIKLTAMLRHPHFPKPLHARMVKGTLLLAMEYLEGNTVKHLLQQHGRLPINWASECVRQAAVGLQYAHEKGLVHRDIKPSNLMVVGEDLSAAPSVKILDFGLARVAQSVEAGITRPGIILGTTDYIAPEQIDDCTHVDIRADIFSLGCTFFEMLTGEPPFGGTTLAEKLLFRQTHEAPAPSSLRSDVPEELDRIVLKMLARETRDRYAIPHDVACDLQILAGKQQPQPASELEQRVQELEGRLKKMDGQLEEVLRLLRG